MVNDNKHRRLEQNILLFSVFAIATCGLIYELVAGALASYLLGDSVTQFSTIIGTYLFSMGIGSWLSKHLKGDLLRWFIIIEILVGVVGGCSAPLLFLSFEHIASFRILLYGLVCLTGIFVGLEIPILMRILKDNLAFDDLIARVFTFDYMHEGWAWVMDSNGDLTAILPNRLEPAE
jgi:spermidine synthase